MIVKTSYDGWATRPRGWKYPDGLHITWNPFGSTQPLQQYLNVRDGSRKGAVLSGDATIRTWALFGLFRKVNPGGMADPGKIDTIGAFRGLLGWLYATGINDAVLLVSLDPAFDVDYPLAVNPNAKTATPIRRLPPPSAPQTLLYSDQVLQYVARAFLGKPFTGLEPLSSDDIFKVCMAGQHVEFRGTNTNYRKLLDPIITDGVVQTEEAWIRGGGLGVAPDRTIGLGVLPSGRVR